MSIAHSWEPPVVNHIIHSEPWSCLIIRMHTVGKQSNINPKYHSCENSAVAAPDADDVFEINLNARQNRIGEVTFYFAV